MSAVRAKVKRKYEVTPKLIQLLDSRGMTQAELAELAGMTQAAISRFSKNNRYEIAHLFAIARALDVSIEELFNVEEMEEAAE